MASQKLSIKILSLLTLGLLCVSLGAEERIFFSTKDGKSEKQIYVFLEESVDGKIRHTTINDGETIESYIDTQGNFISQTIKGPGRNLGVKQIGTIVYVTGIIKGKKVETSYDLGEKKYFGDGFSLAFRYLMSHDLKQLNFIIADFRSDNVTFNEMIIYRENDLTYRNKASSHCVIRMTGLLSLFWAGDFIIARDGKTIYKFEGDQGPGTPHEIIELDSVR